MTDLHPSHALARKTAARWTEHSGERHMLVGLLAWLAASRLVGRATHVTLELPWRGRRVDLATVTSRGVTSAFELKRDASLRVFEQALYNQLSFDRSYVVVPTFPSRESLRLAEELGVGLVQINGDARLWSRPAASPRNVWTTSSAGEAIRRRTTG